MSTKNVNLACFARNVEWDYFCYFQTPWIWRILSIFCEYVLLCVDWIKLWFFVANFDIFWFQKWWFWWDIHDVAAAKIFRVFSTSFMVCGRVVKLALAFELSATTKQHWRNCSHSGGNLAATFVMVATSVCQWLVIKEDWDSEFRKMD